MVQNTMSKWLHFVFLASHNPFLSSWVKTTHLACRGGMVGWGAVAVGGTFGWGYSAGGGVVVRDCLVLHRFSIGDENHTDLHLLCSSVPTDGYCMFVVGDVSVLFVESGSLRFLDTFWLAESLLIKLVLDSSSFDALLTLRFWWVTFSISLSESSNPSSLSKLAFRLLASSGLTLGE